MYIRSLSVFLISLYVVLAICVGASSVQAAPQAFPSVYSPLRGVPVEGSIHKDVLIIASFGPRDGEFYANQLYRLHRFAEMLTSHWDVTVSVADVTEVQPKFLPDYDVVLVVEEYVNDDHRSMLSLLSDFKGAIGWFGFGGNAFARTYGGRTVVDPIQPPPEKGILSYEGVQFSYDPSQTKEFVRYTSLDPAAVVLGEVRDGDAVFPWIIRFAQDRYLFPVLMPYSFNTDNYSLPMLDIFHDILGEHVAQRQALLRLEDVDPNTYKSGRELNAVYKILKRNDVRFHIALISRYLNPSAQVDLTIGDKYRYYSMLQKMVGEGNGTLIQHGYTHQHGDSISGIGYEFWDDQTDGPVANDSEAFVLERLEAVQQIMRQHDLPVPDIWETPHYSLSQQDDEVINRYYPIRYGDLQEGGTLPFVVKLASTIYIPENLGFVFSEEDIPVIAQRLERINVFDDPIASFFWHPWRNPDELTYLIRLMKEHGYTFVSAYDTVTARGPDLPFSGYVAHETFVDFYAKLRRGMVADLWIMLCFGVFLMGAITYVVNRVRMNRYIKTLQVPMSLKSLSRYASEKGVSLPGFAILVPARNEALVIENTIRRLAKLDYPKDKYRVVIIVDERERDDDVDEMTITVVRRVSRELNRLHGSGFVSYFEVPRWYSGAFGSMSRSYAKSTKGRALNYVLGRMKVARRWSYADFIGVLDADGRLDANVLKEVAYKHLSTGAELFQGPVFQVSNFASVSLSGVAAGLELAIHHLTALPHKLTNKQRDPQFLAGTNYFISKNMLIDLGGLNHTALVEDAELSLRVYINRGQTAEWLSWPEIEQTPENVHVYFRQRERWSIGHLELISHIRKSPLSVYEKLKFISLVYVNMLRFFVDVGIPIVSWSLFFGGYLQDIGGGYRNLSLILTVASVFIWDYYGFTYRVLYKLGYVGRTNRAWRDRLSVVIRSIQLVVFMPFFMFVQAAPRFSAAYKYLTGSYSGSWYKTKRTAEVVVE